VARVLRPLRRRRTALLHALVVTPQPTVSIDSREDARTRFDDLVRKSSPGSMRIGRDLQPSSYHTTQLPGGIVTPGDYDHRPLVAHHGLPKDLRGRRALDVASFDGF
jgi:hypothetical protein